MTQPSIPSSAAHFVELQALVDAEMARLLRLIREAVLTSIRFAKMRGNPPDGPIAEGGNTGPSGVASPGRPTPRGAVPLEEEAEGAPHESCAALGHRRPIRS